MKNHNEIEGLQQLIADVDAFTGKVFDWVSFLGRVDFLHSLYEFKDDADQKLLLLSEKVTGLRADVSEAVKEAVVTPDERKLLLDRRFTFCGDAERVVWPETERQSRLALATENYWTTGSDLA